MVNHTKFNKTVRKLDGRQLRAKTFYDFYGHKIIGLGMNEVYLRSDIDYTLKLLKEIFEEVSNELCLLKKKYEDMELENYKMLKKLGKVKVVEEEEEIK
jgi:hypothetical protein